jgi:hypothetical protein
LVQVAQAVGHAQALADEVRAVLVHCRVHP